jgi:hypothetical protein
MNVLVQDLCLKLHIPLTLDHTMPSALNQSSSSPL